MQAFGIFQTNFDHEYLTSHYVYFPLEDEKIDQKDLNAMLKNRRKTVAGTIILFNPFLSPVGYTTNETLEKQGFAFDTKFHELNQDHNHFLIASALKNQYRGKLVEIKYLFNYNKEKARLAQTLEEFDSDLEKYNTSQLTRFDKQLNYIDVPNIRLNGKFVFFGSGHKYEREFHAIYYYAQAIAKQVQKLGKDIAYLYDRNYLQEEALENAYFIEPLQSGKLKDICAASFKKVFETLPPTPQRVN